jgi:hypothetical protein
LQEAAVFSFDAAESAALSPCQQGFAESTLGTVGLKAIKAVTEALARVHVPVVMWGALLEAWMVQCADSMPGQLDVFVPVDHIVSDEHMQLIVVCR